jgi:hypothetical protein
MLGKLCIMICVAEGVGRSQQRRKKQSIALTGAMKFTSGPYNSTLSDPHFVLVTRTQAAVQNGGLTHHNVQTAEQQFMITVD